VQKHPVRNHHSAAASRKGKVLQHRLPTITPECSPRLTPSPLQARATEKLLPYPSTQQPQLLSPLRQVESSTHFHPATLKHVFFLGIWRSNGEGGVSEARAASTHHLQLRHRATQGPFLAVHKRICRTERRNHQVTVVSLEIRTRTPPRRPCSLQAGDLRLCPPFHLA